MNFENNLKNLCEKLGQKILVSFKKIEDKIKCSIKVGKFGWFSANSETKKGALNLCYKLSFESIKTSEFFKQVDFSLLFSTIKEDREEKQKLINNLKKRLKTSKFSSKAEEKLDFSKVPFGKKFKFDQPKTVLRLFRKLKANKFESKQDEFTTLLEMILKGINFYF